MYPLFFNFISQIQASLFLAWEWDEGQYTYFYVIGAIMVQLTEMGAYRILLDFVFDFVEMMYKSSLNFITSLSNILHFAFSARNAID